jgi:hypothetical protein
LALPIRKVFWMIDDTVTKVRYVSLPYEKALGRTFQDIPGGKMEEQFHQAQIDLK